jgi:hypothetical protein
MAIFPGLPTRVIVDPKLKRTVRLATMASGRFMPVLNHSGA